MMLKKLFSCFGLLFSLFSTAQVQGDWLASLHRPDGKDIVFNFKVEYVEGKYILYVINAAEKLRVENIRFTDDSVFIHMPVFESKIYAAIGSNKWEGTWTKGGSISDHVIPFTAVRSRQRFTESPGNIKFDITGRWSVSFAGDTSVAYPSVAEFKQTGNKLTGTILTPTGDYRYLDGVVNGNEIQLSTFDGGHAFLFTATIQDNKTITEGQFYSGKTSEEGWHAVRNAEAIINADAVAMAMRPGEERLNFRFPDLNGNLVSINDEQFKNKVVLVQIMGSWCPNCMDETAFLSDYYKKNKERGIEIISLAYEYTTNIERSVKSIKKFQQRFDVQYPMLITGVAVGDSLRTEKTLPQVTPISFFPSTIIIDKKGRVRKFDTGFVGPGTGQHFTAYTKLFYATIDELLNEQ